jgi:tetratricopeptide (TPR) repeat protein
MKKFLLLFCLLSISYLLSAQGKNFDIAVKAFEASDYVTAMKYLNLDLKEHPKHAEGYYYKARTYHLQNNNVAALDEINTAFQLSTDKEIVTGCYKVRALAYFDMAEYEKAIVDFSTAITWDPSSAFLYTKRGDVYYSLKALVKGENDYRMALKIDHQYIHALEGLARTYFMLKSYDESNKVLKQLMNIAPKNDFAWYCKGRLDYVQGRYNDAIKNEFHALQLDSADTEYRRFFLFFSESNYPLSLSLLNKQIEKDPYCGMWYIIRSRVLYKKGDFAAAITDFNQSVELLKDSKDEDLLYFLAQKYSSFGNYHQAIVYFDRSIKIDSTDAWNYAQRGDVKRLMGDYTGAVVDFTKAIALDSKEPWFYYRRGWIQDEFMKKPQAGLVDYNLAIKMDENCAYPYLHRGLFYKNVEKDTVKANADFNRILSLDTLVKEHGNCRQYALMNLGKHIEAIEWMNKILADYPIEGNYYDAACMYAQMNMPSKSIENLKLAFEKGYVDFIHLSKDNDLDNVRNLPEFKTLVKQWSDQSVQFQINIAGKNWECMMRYVYFFLILGVLFIVGVGFGFRKHVK